MQYLSNNPSAASTPACLLYQAWTRLAQLLPFLQEFAVEMQCCFGNVVCGMLRCQAVVVQESRTRVADLEAQAAASAEHFAAKQVELAESQQRVQIIYTSFQVSLLFAPMALNGNNKSVPHTARKSSSSAYLPSVVSLFATDILCSL